MGGRGGASTSAFVINMSGVTIVAKDYQDLVRQLQRQAKTTPSNRRGPFAGTRSGI
jgi:hypothetical protein